MKNQFDTSIDFVCKCGRKQRRAPYNIKGGITDKEAEKFGWRKINKIWVCPVCCGNTKALDRVFDGNSDEFEAVHRPPCKACTEGMDKVIEREKKNMKEHGWYAHIVLDDPGCPYNYNLHTHGVPGSFGHPDLQICAPLDPKVAHGIIGNIIEQIAHLGKKYEIGILIVDDKVTCGGFPFLLAKAKECGRDVLRVIVSDKNKNLDRETMDLKEQWEGTND